MPFRVTQPVSFTKVYQPAGDRSGPRLGGHGVRTAQNGTRRVPMARNRLSRWGQWVDRKFSDWGAKRLLLSKSLRTATGNDRTQHHRAVRFNIRHEGFSARMKAVVDHLKGADSDLPDRDTTFKTLRNDIKLMAADNPRATESRLLTARLDVELGRLSARQIDDFADNLRRERDRLAGHAFSGTRHGNDLRMLDTMLRVTARHQVARSPQTAALLDDLVNRPPNDVSDRNAIRKAASDLRDEIEENVIPGLGQGEMELKKATGMDTFDLANDMVKDALRLRLQLQNPTRDDLAVMNRKLLNVSQALRGDLRQMAENDNRTLDDRDTELLFFASGLRALNQAVRREFLDKDISNRGFRDSQARSRFTHLGAGGAHSVTKARYQVSANLAEKVYKGDDDTVYLPGSKDRPFAQPRRFAAPMRIGIDSSSPRLLERAVATSRIDEQLGFGCYVKVDPAVHEDDLGQVMELAPGKPASDSRHLGWAFRTNQAQMQQQLVRKQLLDTITGQVDGHRANYLIDVKGSNVSVKGIDPDYGLGPGPKDPADILGKHGVWLPDLPPVVDTEMVDRINHLNAHPEILDEIMGGRLSDDALEATKQRLAVVAQHVNSLSQDRVIHPSQWGSKTVSELLMDRGGLVRGFKKSTEQLVRTRKKLRKDDQKLASSIDARIRKLGLERQLPKGSADPFELLNFLHTKKGRSQLSHSDGVQLIQDADRLAKIRAGIQRADDTMGQIDKEFATIRRLDRELADLRDRGASGSKIRRKLGELNQSLESVHDLTETPYSSYWQREMYVAGHMAGG